MCSESVVGANMTVDQTLLITVQMSVNSANVIAGKSFAYVKRLAY